MEADIRHSSPNRPKPWSPAESARDGRGQGARSSYRPDIDGLRAAAVIPVVLYHANLGFPGGFTGVDVFFVISGFLITSLIREDIELGRFSLGRFYERRIRRIFPALFAVIAASFVAAYLLFLPPELTLFAKSGMAAALFSSNILFWLEAGYFDSAALAKPLLHSWSLAVEEQYYILFPIVLLALRRLARGWLLVAIGALWLLSFASSCIATAAYPEAAFYLMPMRFWEIATGALLAISQFRLSERYSRLCAAAGLLMILTAVIAYGRTTSFPGAAALLPCGGALLVILAGATPNAVSNRLSARPLVFVGLISYSLYLWHWPLLVFSQYRLGRLLRPEEAGAVVILSIILASLSWRWIELPFRRRGKVGGRRAIFAGAVAATAVTLASGQFVVSGKGLPWRLPDRVGSIYAYSERHARFHNSECFAGRRGEGPSLADIRAGRTCMFGPPGGRAPSFLLWGDSHASALSPMIEALSQRYRVRGYFVGRSSCLPLIDYRISDPSRSKQNRCSKANLAVLDLIRSGGVKTVLLVGRWPREVLGAEYGNEGIFFDPHQPYQTTDRSALVAAGLDRTLSEIRRLGAQAVVVQDVPEIGYDVPHALALAALRGVKADIAPMRSTVDARQGAARKIVRDAALHHGAKVVDPLPFFCNAERCRVEAGGVLLYADEDHVSEAGAMRLAPFFAPWLRPGAVAATPGSSVVVSRHDFGSASGPSGAGQASTRRSSADPRGRSDQHAGR